MHIRVLSTAVTVAASAARLIIDRIDHTPRLVLGLPTGATPVPLYDALVQAYTKGRVDFSRVTTFNLDEFYGVGRGHPGSYHTFMQQRLFSRVNLKPARTHLLDGLATDWRAEVRRYETAIADAGGLDLVVLGIGRNGHLGFNEPAPTLTARTHRVKLRPESRRANAALFDNRWQDVPQWALSMGMGTILTAREVVLVATGSAKAAIVKRALEGPVTTRVPASLLQLHPSVTVFLDADAGAALHSQR